MTFIPKDKVEGFLEKLAKSASKHYSDGLETISPPAGGIPEEGIYSNLNLDPEEFKEFLFFESLDYFNAKRKDDEMPARFRHERRPMVVLYQSSVYYFIKDLGIKKARELLAAARNDHVKESAEGFLEICLNPKEVVPEKDYRKYHEELILKRFKIHHTFRGRPIIHESAFLRKEPRGLN